jgi:hypothetical protein
MKSFLRLFTDVEWFSKTGSVLNHYEELSGALGILAAILMIID